MMSSSKRVQRSITFSLMLVLVAGLSGARASHCAADDTGCHGYQHSAGRDRHLGDYIRLDARGGNVHVAWQKITDETQSLARIAYARLRVE